MRPQAKEPQLVPLQIPSWVSFFSFSSLPPFLFPFLFLSFLSLSFLSYPLLSCPFLFYSLSLSTHVFFLSFFLFSLFVILFVCFFLSSFLSFLLSVSLLAFMLQTLLHKIVFESWGRTKTGDTIGGLLIAILFVSFTSCLARCVLNLSKG